MEEYQTSKINGAMLKMVRLDKALSTLNEINNNLLAFNNDYQVFNFELKLTSIDSIYQEVDSKLNQDERDDLIKLRNAIDRFLKENPIISIAKNNVTRKESKYKVNYEALNILKKWLFIYESKARRMIDKYGMDTMYEDIDAIDEY